MGRELQKKKRRSGRAVVRQSNKTKKILNPRGNSIIAKNWYEEEKKNPSILTGRTTNPSTGTRKKHSHKTTAV